MSAPISKYVLYLRPFRSDAGSITNSLSSWTFALSMLMTGSISLFSPFKTMAQRMARAFRKRGLKLVQLNEGQVDLVHWDCSIISDEFIGGASESDFCPVDEGWQSKAVSLCAWASCIIIHAGDSPGLIWELAHIRKAIPPQQVLIIVPNGARHDDLARVAKLLEEIGYLVEPLRFVPGTVHTFSRDWRGEAWSSANWAAEDYVMFIEDRIH